MRRGWEQVAAHRFPIVGLLVSVIFLWCDVPSFAGSETKGELDAAIWEVKQMRGADKVSYEAIEKKCAEFLKRFSDPKDQGQIWFELTRVYGQTAGPPQRTIECAKKALEFPLDTVQQLRLYNCWGNARLHVDPNEPFPEKRREAGAIFLRGLATLRDKQVPESDKAMKQQRDALTRGVLRNYGRWPYATEELRELATKLLQDPKLVQDLMATVEADIKAEKYGAPPKLLPSEPVGSVPAVRKGRGTQLLLTTGAFCILMVAFGVRRWRAR